MGLPAGQGEHLQTCCMALALYAVLAKQWTDAASISLLTDHAVLRSSSLRSCCATMLQ